MKIIAQTAALQEALALAGSVVITRTPKPVLQCVKLIASGKTLTMLATDLEIGCRYQVTAVQVEQEGEALIPADKLSGIVRESGGDESLTIQTEKESSVISGAGSKFKVFGYDPAEYPVVAEFPDTADFQIPVSTLAPMITRTLFATAKAHSHYAISGVLLEASGKKIQLVATDGHRLAQSKGTLAKAASSDVVAIIPAKLMSMIQKVSAGEESLDIRIQGNQILVRTARATIVSSLVQGNFPKYGDVIPKESNRKATISTGRLEHAIRQAALMTNEDSHGIKLSFKADKVVMTGRTPEAGESEAHCPAKLEGDPIDIAFNPAFLLDAIKVVGSDEVAIEMNAPNKPAVLKAGGDFLYVLMPVDLGS